MRHYRLQIALGYTLLISSVLVFFLTKLIALPSYGLDVAYPFVLVAGLAGLSSLFIGSMNHHFKEHPESGGWKEMRRNATDKNQWSRPVNKNVLLYLLLPAIISGLLYGMVEVIANGNFILLIPLLLIVYMLGYGIYDRYGRIAKSMQKYVELKSAEDQAQKSNTTESSEKPSTNNN